MCALSTSVSYDQCGLTGRLCDLSGSYAFRMANLFILRGSLVGERLFEKMVFAVPILAHRSHSLGSNQDRWLRNTRNAWFGSCFPPRNHLYTALNVAVLPLQ